jgi:phospholipid/cholesterol/gamma-HCH transport system substrate-binding protein
MPRYTRLEVSVGAFMALGGLALAYLSFTLAGAQFGPSEHYTILARFSSVGSLKVGDPVTVAGVNVGEVQAIQLVDFVAEASLSLDAQLKLPEDTIASVQSAGLLGDSYVSLSPGASEKDLQHNGRISHTEPAISLTELIAKYAFGSPLNEDKSADQGTAEQSDDLDLSVPAANQVPTGSAATSGAAGSSAPAKVPPKKSPFSDPLE